MTAPAPAGAPAATSEPAGAGNGAGAGTRTAVDPAAVHAAIAELLPRIAAGALRADEDRRVDADVVAALCAADAHRLLQPARYGGAEASVVEHVQAAAKAAEGCVAAGWCVGLWSVHNWMLAMLDPAIQDEVWADPTSLTSGSIVPRTAFPADGPDHVVIQGRFGFASGSDHADWLLIGGLVPRDGAPAPAIAVVPRSAATIDADSWDVTGLRGSGSKDVVVAEPLRVARQRFFFPEDVTRRTAAGQAHNPATLYQAPFHTIGLLALAPPALGGARAALARFIERLDGHRLTATRRTQRIDPAARLRVVEAAAAIDAAERTMVAAAELCDEAGRIEGRDRLAEVTIGRDAAYAVRACARAVDLLYEAAGGSALSRREPMQRIWRDVHAVRAHAVLTWDGAANQYADALLGPVPTAT